MKPSGISPLLLEKYLSGQCTDEEKALVDTWYASLKGEPDFLDQLPPEEEAQIRQDTFEGIRRDLHFQEEEPARSFPWRWLAGIAASIALVLGIFLAAPQRKAPAPSIAQQLQQKPASELVSFRNTGKRIVIHRLPDNSSVAMRPNAEVTYPATFDDNQRLVTFSGEGFFDIQKDKTRPFYIQSGEMVIKVLGTSFNVKAQSHEKVFQVDVVTGTVEVSAYTQSEQSQQVILKPQQQALLELDAKRLTSKTIALQTKKEIYEPVTIVFEETPLNNVISQLKKRFNIDIVLANNGLSRCTLTGNFESQPFTSILEQVCASLEVTYTMHENTITISGEPCE